MHNAEILIPILVPLGAFAMVFGIIYLRTRENMAMIEKGMNPKRYANLPAPFRSLKTGLLFLGAGIGLLLMSQKKAQSRNSKLVMINLKTAPKEILHLANLQKIIDIH